MVNFPARVGVWWSSDFRPIGEAAERAAELDELGYGSLWYGEAYGKETLTQAGALLGATRRIAVGTGIANIPARDALAAESGGCPVSATRLRLGFTDDEMPRGGSDRLEDALVVWGDEAAIKTRVDEHLDAGADHVCIQVLGEELFADPVPDLRKWHRHWWGPHE